MKICFFAETYFPVISGTSISLQRIVRELDKKDIDSYVITALYPGSVSNPRVIYYQSYPLPRRFDFRFGTPIARKMLPFIKRISPDIIHAQQPFMSGRSAIKIANALNIPLIGTIHTQYDHDSYLQYLSPLPKRVMRFIVRKIIRDFCNSCSAVTTPARGMASNLTQIDVHTPIYVVPNGVDDSFTLLNRSITSLTTGLKKLIFVGRLTKEKNLAFLISSFALVLQKDPNVVLYLVGDGPEKENLKKQVSVLGIASSVHFTGWVDQNKLGIYYVDSDIFVMPSISEVNPLCLMEALTSGLPIVAVDSYAARQILEHEIDSILTEPTLEDFSKAINYVLGNNDVRYRMQISAKGNSQKFLIKNQVKQLLDIYSQVIEEYKSSPSKDNKS